MKQKSLHVKRSGGDIERYGFTVLSDGTVQVIGGWWPGLIRCIRVLNKLDLSDERWQ